VAFGCRETHARRSASTGVFETVTHRIATFAPDIVGLFGQIWDRLSAEEDPELLHRVCSSFPSPNLASYVSRTHIAQAAALVAASVDGLEEIELRRLLAVGILTAEEGSSM
jgi:hypothetical protein